MQKGFTLIEILIAINVMIVGVVGIYALVPSIIKTTATNSNRFTGSQFAREGVELVRNIRDQNWLNMVNWDTGLTGCGTGCEMDYDDAGLIIFQNRLLKVDTNGFYNYETGTESIFKRKIIITPQGNWANVKVQIIWSGEGSPLEVEENLYDWR